MLVAVLLINFGLHYDTLSWTLPPVSFIFVSTNLSIIQSVSKSIELAFCFRVGQHGATTVLLYHPLGTTQTHFPLYATALQSRSCNVNNATKK